MTQDPDRMNFLILVFLQFDSRDVSVGAMSAVHTVTVVSYRIVVSVTVRTSLIAPTCLHRRRLTMTQRLRDSITFCRGATKTHTRRQLD